MNDIPGAQARVRFQYRSGTPVKEPIEGAQTKPQISQYTKRDPLEIKDIPGTRPAKLTFTTERIVDSMNPSYIPLGNDEMFSPPSPPRFIRDTLDNSDVNGAKPKERMVRNRGNDGLDGGIDRETVKAWTRDDPSQRYKFFLKN